MGRDTIIRHLKKQAARLADKLRAFAKVADDAYGELGELVQAVHANIKYFLERLDRKKKPKDDAR